MSLSQSTIGFQPLKRGSATRSAATRLWVIVLPSMAEPFVSSNPHAFLRPIYRRLAADRTLHLLAEPHQYERLVAAVAKVSEHHAALMREHSAPAKQAILRHLASAESLRPGEPEVELWRLRKGDRELVCVAVYLPVGVDVRVLEAVDIRKTQLVKDGPHAELAAEWKNKSEAAGWA